MMKSNRKTIVLLVVFFLGLFAYMAAEQSGIRTQWEEIRRRDRVLPDLIDAPEVSIRRVAIDRGDEHLVFERRGKGLGHWQMIEPKHVAAEPTRLETLVRHLKDLRKSPDAGTIPEEKKEFGLTPPPVTVRLFAGDDQGSSAADRPIAAIDIGKTVQGRRYVRPSGEPGIDVVDARLLAAVDLPLPDWRQPVVMGLPTFQVTSIEIERQPSSGRPPQVIRAERSGSGRWKLKAPIEAPANGPKIESLLGALASLRVADAPEGYVADDVKDLAPFGLEKPALTVKLATGGENEPLVLHVGKPVSDDPDRVYVQQGGQDDVVMVDVKALGEIPEEASALRSKQVTDIVPAAVTEIEIRTRSDVFTLKKGRAGWALTSPREERADGQAVQDFLKHIDELQASEFLDPKIVPEPMLDPPVMSIRIRQAEAGRPPASSTNADASLALNLRLGKQDILKKTIFARLEGDSVILALPDTLLNVLPKNPLAFRDRTIVTDNPGQIRKLTIRRGARVDEVVPDEKGGPNHWRMLRPVEAAGDTTAITQALTVLCNLRAEEFAAPAVGDGKVFGLDRPTMEVEWASDGTHILKVGAPVPRTLNYFATIEGRPGVFMLAAANLRPLDAELHDHHVLGFPAARARRVVLRWPFRTVVLRHRPAQVRGQVEWVPEPGSEAEGIDLSRIASLVGMMAQLQTTRFIQYGGELPAAAGLARPRLTVEVTCGPKDPLRVLRIGKNAEDGLVCAATGTESTGPAFLLPGPPWNELIRSGERFPPLPDDVFAPPN